MSGRLNLATDGRDWPKRAFSRIVDAGGLPMHVQIAGHGPTILLLHGTGPPRIPGAACFPCSPSASPSSHRICRATASPAIRE